MKKKMWHLYRVLVLFSCLFLSNNPAHSQGSNVFDDLFKGFDFDAFLKDMEKAYDEETERKAFGGAAKPATTAAATAATTAAAAASAGTEKTIITQAPAKKPQTKEELFLTPITQTIQEKGKPTKTKLSPESLNAFKEVMHEFITLLDAVTTKVENSRIFSLPFKEQFYRYNDAIDKVAIAYGTMVSKKMYSTIMPFAQAPDLKAPQAAGAKPAAPKAPQPKEVANLRKNILDATKELRELDKELSKLLVDEEKEADIQVLRELSKHKRKKITFDQPATSKRKRSQTTKKQTTKQKDKPPHQPQASKPPLTLPGYPLKKTPKPLPKEIL
jgi:uncharacterized protein YaaR (DUF327 family)